MYHGWLAHPWYAEFKDLLKSFPHTTYPVLNVFLMIFGPYRVSSSDTPLKTIAAVF